jgi:hypothetical protein
MLGREVIDGSTPSGSTTTQSSHRAPSFRPRHPRLDVGIAAPDFRSGIAVPPRRGVAQFPGPTERTGSDVRNVVMRTRAMVDGCPASQEAIAWAHAILDAIKRGFLARSSAYSALMLAALITLPPLLGLVSNELAKIRG